MTRSLPRLGALVAVGLTAALAAAGCSASGSGTTSAEQGGTISVVTSTDVWASVARAVTTGLDERIRVSSIVNDPAADPHSYEATPRDAATISDASLVVVNGGGYDPYVTDVLSSSGGKGIPVVDAVDVHGAVGADPGNENEHVFYDVTTVTAVAARIADELGRLDPADAATLSSNAARFADATAPIAATVAAVRAQRSGTTVVQTEPVAQYLVEAAGLVDATPTDFSRAVEDETDPPASAVASMTDLLTSGRARLLVDNTQTEGPVTEQVRATAQSAGLPVVGVTETLPASATGWVDWMTAETSALAAALGVTTS